MMPFSLIPSPQTWLKWAALFMPPRESGWLTAMTAELAQISKPAERQAFAFGCFKAALLQGAGSRKGLHYIARAGGAAGLIALGSVSYYVSAKWGAAEETLGASKVLMSFCAYYMLSAALLLASLKMVKIYAGLGFLANILGWAYFGIFQPRYAHISTEFLMAINFEAAGLMAMLFCASVYLSLLYSPQLHDA